MILKNDSINFQLKIFKTDSNIGLREGDFWLNIQIILEGSDFQYEFSQNALSHNELNYFIKALDDLVSSNDAISKRISFIKNYFVVYLKSLKNGKKFLKIKFINVDDEHNNIVIKFEDDEIQKLADEIMKYN